VFKKNGKIKRLEKTVFFSFFFRKNGKKRKKNGFTPNYTYFMLLDKSFAMKLGYYRTLGLGFQTASKIARYSAHPYFITNNEVNKKRN